LSHDSIYLDVNDPADQLITGADSAKLGAALRKRHPLFGKVQVFVQLAFRDAMMPALGFHGTHFPGVDPTLQRGITDAEHFRGVPKLYQFGMIAQESNSSSEKMAVSRPS
jgi:hypothetical protein